MKMPTFLATREARENFKDKFEVFMAVVVLTNYAYKKYKESQEEEVPVITTLQEQK